MKPLSLEGPVTISPSSLTLPSLGSSNPSIMRSKVVFPHPDGPTKDTNLPVSIVRLMSFNANTSSSPSFDTKVLDTFSISMSFYHLTRISFPVSLLQTIQRLLKEMRM